MKYNFRPVADWIFLLEFEDRYDLAMHFLRVQEYYESPNPKFKGQPFNIWDYIRWYSKNNDNKFTYASDWTGFNVTGDALDNLYSHDLIDNNKYDDFMRGILKFIKAQVAWRRFYLIGTTIGDEETLKHELAHGLWSLNAKYEDLQTKNIEDIPEKTYQKLRANLIVAGYDEGSLDDEIHAYMSTGFANNFVGTLDRKKLKKYAKAFEKTFKEHYNA